MVDFGGLGGFGCCNNNIEFAFLHEERMKDERPKKSLV